MPDFHKHIINGECVIVRRQEFKNGVYELNITFSGNEGDQKICLTKRQ